jgi:hypothetical protein
MKISISRTRCLKSLAILGFVLFSQSGCETTGFYGSANTYYGGYGMDDSFFYDPWYRSRPIYVSPPPRPYPRPQPTPLPPWQPPLPARPTPR